MTQYHNERPPTTAVEPAISQLTRDRDALEHLVASLSDRIDQQTEDLREIERSLKKLQNEVRTAVNSFNLRRHG